MPAPDPDREEAIEVRQKDQKVSGRITPLSLLERARANDAVAWQQLVKLYHPLVLFWCQRGGLSGQDAEDLSQEVFAATALGLARFRRDQPGDTFRGWLRVITKNEILMHRRREARHPPPVGGSASLERLQEVSDPLAGSEEEEHVEFSRVCRRVMEQVRGEFEDKTWQAFWLTVVEGRSPATLTGDLGMTAAAIRQAKSRVLRRLRKEVGELLE
jgi:RNA polymerase sigma-70 factor (ECF subfamily)